MKTTLYPPLALQTLLFTSASLLFLLLLIYPKGREIYQNTVGLEQKRIKIDNANAALIDFPTVAKEFVQVKNQTENEKSHLVLPNQVGDILAIASGALEGTSLELLSLQPEQQLLSQPFSLGPNIEFQFFPVTLKLSGKYEDIARFTDMVLNQKKWAILDQITFKKSTGTALQAELKILFFLSKESLEEKEKNNSMETSPMNDQKLEEDSPHV